MRTLQNLFLSAKKKFIVTKKDTNNNKSLLLNVLHQQMEEFIISIISNSETFIFSSPQLFELQLLKNSYLNDKLLIKAQI